MLALLMIVFGPRLVGGAIGQISSPGLSGRVGRLVADAYDASSRYVWLMALRALAIGVITGGAFAIAGFETPTALGLWFAVLSLIPGLGVVIAALPIAVYEGVTSYPLAVLLFLSAVLFQALDSNFVQSRIDLHSVRIGPGLTIMATLFGLQLYGIGGVLVALAVVIFSVALLRELARGHDDVFTAFRTLVQPPAIVDSVEALMEDNE
jgi:predicted PurR-regulated permease PerM